MERMGHSHWVCGILMSAEIVALRPLPRYRWGSGSKGGKEEEEGAQPSYQVDTHLQHESTIDRRLSE
jgi:hypothetical protein